MISVLVADDELRIRDGIAGFITNNLAGFKVVSICQDGDEAIDYIKTHDVDIIITDIRMKRISGLEVAEFVHNERPNTKVVMLSGYQEFDYAKKAIEFGVKAYLLKPTDFEELTRVLQGFAAYEPDLSDQKDDEPLPEFDGVIKKILEYIDQNYTRDISLQEVSDYAYLNPVYCSRLFKQTIGKNFSDYILEKRMKKAGKMILEHKKIEIIAASCGYNNSGYFSRVFKEYFGCTPKEYRNNTRG